MPQSASRTPQSTSDGVQVLVLAISHYSSVDQLYYVESPQLDLVRAGQTAVEAMGVFVEGLRILLDGWWAKGILEQRLKDQHFELASRLIQGRKSVAVYHVPPAAVPETTLAGLEQAAIGTVPYSVTAVAKAA